MDDQHARAAEGRHRAPRGTPASSARPGRVRAVGLHVAAPVAVPPERCPSCASRVGPREEWCSLCHAALRTVPGAPAVLEPAPVAPAAATAEPVAGPLGAGAAGETGPRLDAAVVEAMLAELAAEAPPPGVRGLPSGRAKVLVAAVGGVGLTGLLLLAMTVAGAVLG